MNTKKITVILISVVFFLIAVFSVVGVLSIKKIDVTYAVSENYQIESVQEVLNAYNGKNLLFLKEEEVREALSAFHYLEIVELKKNYPNVLTVAFKERREIYYFDYLDKTYITDQTGFVLKEFQLGQFDGSAVRDKIKLDVSELKIKSVVVGSIIEVEERELFSSVLTLAEKANLTDCVKEIVVEELPGDGSMPIGSVVYNLTFKTYTGVGICIEDVLDRGEAKVVNAFIAYDTMLTDYQKKFGEIQSYVDYNGKENVTYNQQDIGW